MAYYNAKGIRKEVEAVAEYQKKLNNNTLNLQCKCRHRDERGSLSIRPDGARPDGSKFMSAHRVRQKDRYEEADRG